MGDPLRQHGAETIDGNATLRGALPLGISIARGTATTVQPERANRRSFRSVYPSHTEPPPLSSHTVSGEPISLAKLRGNVVLLTFWASWCAECRPEMPLFERLHAEFARQGLAVLGLNIREDQDQIRRYAKALGLTFPLVLDPEGEIARSYGVIGIPTTILIGRDLPERVSGSLRSSRIEHCA